MTPLTIHHRTIAPAAPPFIIAEIGVNHDGDPQRALELVDAAHAAGADAIKLQVFRADSLMHNSGRFADYQKHRCPEDNPVQMLRRYELALPDLRRIVQHARDLDLAPIATPFSLPDIDIIRQLDLSAVKIASPDIVNTPLLRAALLCAKPLILSTGAATLEEIDQTATWLGGRSPANCQLPTANFALLHCISSYPTPDDQANLCWITELAARFDLPIGYSDHTTNILSGALAVAAGACILEKHLTYDRAASGPDHSASADPQQFAQYVRLARQAQTLRGLSGKRVLPSEQDVRTVSRQSLVLTRDIAAGECIGCQDLTVQRPGTGIPAADFDVVVGLRPARPLPAGIMLQWTMLAQPREVSHAA